MFSEELKALVASLNEMGKRMEVMSSSINGIEYKLAYLTWEAIKRARRAKKKHKRKH